MCGAGELDLQQLGLDLRNFFLANQNRVVLNQLLKHCQIELVDRTPQGRLEGGLIEVLLWIVKCGVKEWQACGEGLLKGSAQGKAQELSQIGLGVA